MRRREFLSGLLLVVTVGRLQAAPNGYRIAIVAPTAPVTDMNERNRYYGALLGNLRRLGYIEGQNLVGHLARRSVFDVASPVMR